MNAKEFFRPTVGKVLLFAVLLAIFSVAFPRNVCIEGSPVVIAFPYTFSDTVFGFPYTFYSQCYSLSGDVLIPDPPQFEPIQFIVDIIFWYIIAAIIIFAYQKSRKVGTTETKGGKAPAAK